MKASIISLIKSCTQKSHLLQLHSLLIRSSHIYNPAVFLSFLSHLALPPFRYLSYAAKIFHDFPAPNVSLYNTMIKAHSLDRDSARGGVLLYQDLLRSGISPNALSATVALKCCAKLESLWTGIQIHGRIWKDGHLSDGLLMTALMDLYSRSREAPNAWKVFVEMPHRDVVAWNVLISCCTRNNRTRDALELFDTMKDSHKCQPDDVTCLLVLQACASLNTLEWGEKVHSYITEHSLHKVKTVCNSLISMYSRCGSVEKANYVFKQMVNRDVISWTAMISGLASNGFGQEAIEAFYQMQREGVSPGEQTFTGVLSACSHSGLVNEGRLFFNSMNREFGVKPNKHHYGCMVDLLGRAGLLNEAYEVIISLTEIKPDALMWRTLLGACRIHGNVDLGERVVDHLVELKAQEAGDYILLLNIYSSGGKPEKVMDVRKMMKEIGIQTTPASSTIELNRRIHEFYADDISHPRTKEIYDKLAEINQQLRIGGYVSEITSEEETKKGEAHMLSHHSEKLAIAFGVLATPPGTTIRVAKDLRICVDCHSFCKILSSVYNRKVVVRDRNRFHHFREGRCSCNDYW